MLTAATVLAAVLIYAANLNARYLSDSLFQFDFAVVNIITAACVAVFTMAWLAWLWFFSGWPLFWSRFLPTVAVLFGLAFLICYRPMMEGALSIDRWEPRFWAGRTLELETVNKLANLSETTPYDFPQFLGPQRNGQVDRFSVQLGDPNRTRTLVWKIPIGAGWSGMVAVNGFAVTMMQDAADEVVVCYDLQTGTPYWTYRHQRRFDDVLGGVGPRATPTIAGGKVYAVGAHGLLVCLQGDSGELIWKQDLTDLLDISLVESTTPAGIVYQTADSKVMWGRAGSPLVYNDLVIVPGGGPRDGRQVSLLAFNRETGEEIWRGGSDGIGYSSPVAVDLAGAQQIVIVNESTVTGHDPKTGDVWWSFDRPGNSDADANTSQATLVDDNHLLLSKGYGMGGELIQVSHTADGKFIAESVWKNQRVLKTKMTNPVVHEGHAYALSDGILECVDLENGQRVWKRGRYGHGQLLRVGDKLLIHAENGVLAVVVCTPNGFDELGRFDTIDGICWNTICVYDRYVLVRSDLEAACYEMTESLAQSGQRDANLSETDDPPPTDTESDQEKGGTEADKQVDDG